MQWVILVSKINYRDWLHPECLLKSTFCCETYFKVVFKGGIMAGALKIGAVPTKQYYRTVWCCNSFDQNNQQVVSQNECQLVYQRCLLKYLWIILVIILENTAFPWFLLEVSSATQMHSIWKSTMKRFDQFWLSICSKNSDILKWGIKMN